ncbi:MAG: NUDIX domain-containing protein [Bdellovibrionales bacterium]
MKVRRQRVSIIVIHEGKILGFHAEDPFSKKRYFFLPGGEIEQGEGLIAAALREAFEETGYQVDVIRGLHLRRHYDFEWNGIVHDCVTDFLAGRLKSITSQPVEDASYHRGVDWVSVDDIDTVFGYNADIADAVRQLTHELTAIKKSVGPHEA